MALKQTLIQINRGIAWLQVKILTPLLLTLLWIAIGFACVIPRLVGAKLLLAARRGADTHWQPHAPIDQTERGMRRQG